ncbi:MAG: hypothetical protein O9282_14095 [Flavobacterium sp.]|jgi:hypothetical protein|uniref:hypothetical protein n=1 Tax=Flavobacterium sp. TaxID=239 RepID=UPI0022BE3457|nr:hypothetical protein [Flavobacterium sp.]MCZ8332437.1 hypothetical protein [Flavobacterium sp.]
MPKYGPFPSKEADLNSYFQIVVPYLLENRIRLLISQANQDLISSKLEAWNEIFPQSQNSNTKTKTIIQIKDEAKEELMTALRAVYADIPASIWTIEDRNTLNMPERSTSKTPVPVPTTVPIGQVNTSRRLEHTISFTNEDGSSAKPFGVHGCQIWYKIGTPAVDPSELSFMFTDTSSPHIHQFNGEHVGKNVYYWLRWENTRGETGPWSDVVMATITG